LKEEEAKAAIDREAQTKSTRSAGWWLRLIYCERKILLAG
jgi:hypothetical protein